LEKTTIDTEEHLNPKRFQSAAGSVVAHRESQSVGGSGNSIVRSGSIRFRASGFTNSIPVIGASAAAPRREKVLADGRKRI
jgi:hypothetical protein